MTLLLDFGRERKQSKHRCADGDPHGANTLYPGIRKSALWRLLFSCISLMKTNSTIA
jgi:hypothetical protein